MERSYTILLDRGGGVAAKSPKIRGFEDFEAPSRLLSEPPRPVLHRERLNTQELRELSTEPDFVAAAEIMSTRLLSPLPEEATAAGIVDSANGRRRLAWGVGAVGADRSKYTGADVSVALLDSGIDAAHEAFRDMEIVEKDFTGLGGGDAVGHGTHSAGIVFGRSVDGIRIGVAPGVRRGLIGKVVGPAGGDSDMLMRGLAWAHEQRAHVISLSACFDFAATAKKRAEEGWTGEMATAVALEAYRDNLILVDKLLHLLRLQEPFTGGAIIVAAAGDDSRRGPEGEHVMTACPPCGCDKVVSVGAFDPATGRGYRISDFSNCGVEIAAPGRTIVSAAAGGGLRAFSGTSSAAPHVAGVAALWWQAVRQSELPATATLVRGKLLENALVDGFSAAVYPGDRGAGRVCAPRDGLALMTLPMAARGFERGRPGADDFMLAAGRLRENSGESEPISLGGGGSRSGLH